MNNNTNNNNTTSSEITNVDENTKKALAEINSAIDKYQSEKQNPHQNHKEDLEENRESIVQAGVTIGDIAQDDLSHYTDEDAARITEMWGQCMEKYEEQLEKSGNIGQMMENDESRSSVNPLLEKESLKVDNSICRNMVACVSETDRIVRASHIPDLDPTYDEQMRELDVLAQDRHEKAREHMKYLNYDIEQEQNIIQSIQEKEDQKNKEEKEDSDINKDQESKKREIEDSDTEDQESKKQKTDNTATGSIIDDYADPSTEPGDWTGGDD